MKQNMGKMPCKGIFLMGFSRDESLEWWFGGRAFKVF
jgi:hypothetical protein